MYTYATIFMRPHFAYNRVRERERETSLSLSATPFDSVAITLYFALVLLLICLCIFIYIANLKVSDAILFDGINNFRSFESFEHQKRYNKKKKMVSSNHSSWCLLKKYLLYYTCTILCQKRERERDNLSLYRGAIKTSYPSPHKITKRVYV